MRAFKHLPPSRYHRVGNVFAMQQPGGSVTCIRCFNITDFMPGGTFEDRRLQRGDTLLLGTGNNNKLKELSQSITLMGLFNCLTTKEMGLPSPEETGTTYFDNAAIKALDAAARSGLPTLGDDRGIAIDAYDGQPGVDTIEWLRDPKVGFGKVAALADERRSRRATSVCAMALAWPDGAVAGVEIHTRGKLVWPPRGDNGFGFDSIFCRAGETRTYAEMSTMEKGMNGEIGDAIRFTMQHLADPFGHYTRHARPRQMEILTR